MDETLLEGPGLAVTQDTAGVVWKGTFTVLDGDVVLSLVDSSVQG